ncbi:hypothetical protein BG005_000764 [Podila minutissima]|nr:hypothetical protein BG005_000764 [Podila minutissima]
MSFPTDSKRTAPSAPPSIAVEEQATFGRQAPFASSVSGLAPSGLAPSGPQGSTEHSNNHLNQSLNPQEYPDTLHQAPPPTYDEVTRAPGAPQLPHGDHSNSSNSNYGDQPESSEHYSPSAPLLAPGTQGSNGYSSIPGPPVRSYASSVSSYASSSDPGRERRFNKFWIIFFAVVLILLVFDNDQQGREGFITVEQDTKAEFTQFFVEAYASDRDRLRSIRTGVTQSEEAGKFYASTFATANYQDSGCVFANIRIVFGGQLKQVRRLKIASMEGNVTINMLDEGQAEILELDSRVITGHSSIRVKVPGEATIGGSVGTIRGDLELGNTFAVNMVEGNVAVNLAKSPSSRAMQGKVVVAQGNVTVGLVPHYNGVYTVETGDGDADLQNIDAERTVVQKEL